MPLNREQAGVTRDTLAKALYHRVFTSVVDKVSGVWLVLELVLVLVLVWKRRVVCGVANDTSLMTSLMTHQRVQRVT